MSCTGCCQNGVCMGGNSNDACGYDGRACSQCPATHRCEAPGACYPHPTMNSLHAATPNPSEAECIFVDGQLRCL